MSLNGRCSVGGDKSISHRVAIAAALATGVTRVHGYSDAGDCAATLRAVERLGARVTRLGDGSLIIEGVTSIRDALGVINLERSGTALRLLAGVLASMPCNATLTGDAQLLRRPMKRVVAPLQDMGADIASVDGRAPLRIRGRSLHGVDHQIGVASAQVKSALLLAGLRADGATTIAEPHPSRDHTELLLAAMGAEIGRSGNTVSITPGALQAIDVEIPGDPSSAAFLLCAAALVPGSDVTVTGVCLNPTRIHFVEVLARMGADIELEPIGVTSGGETVGNIRCRAAALQATTISADEVPLLIDELPILALVATAAEGVSAVHGAAELRVKESDRIATVVQGLRTLGAEVDELADGYVITGPATLHGGVCDAKRDHRLAMTWGVADLVASSSVSTDSALIGDSFPGFAAALGHLGAAA